MKLTLSVTGPLYLYVAILNQWLLVAVSPLGVPQVVYIANVARVFTITTSVTNSSGTLMDATNSLDGKW